MDETTTDPYVKMDGPHPAGTIPPGESVVNIQGPPGESVFCHLVVWCITAESLEILQTELNDQFVHVRDANDDRLLALVSALVVENAVDGLLSALMPGYTALRNRMDITFSMRIQIAKAMRIIPSRILGCADFVRRVRNMFAHNLSIKSFDQLEPCELQSMMDRLSQYDPDLLTDKSHAEVFEQLVVWTAVALRAYSLQVAALGEFVRTEEFMSGLKQYATREG
jgi:hypothetical protein